MSESKNLSISSPVFQKLLKPLYECMLKASHTRSCIETSDKEWVETGILRVLSEASSGRDFLQKLFLLGKEMSVANFFSNLRSSRRLFYLKDILALLLNVLKQERETMDPLKEYEELNKFQVFAADGHYHSHACHDPKIDGSHWATQHFYALNYRSFGLSHFALAEIGNDVKKESDLKACKKKNIIEMRQGAGKGLKTLYVWDKAIIDYKFWAEMKRNSVYFLTLCKSNLLFNKKEDLEFDKSDPINKGILLDQILFSKTDGVPVRKISYQCPVSGKFFNFLTNLHQKIRPGVVAMLYKMRWDIEKVFDEIKNQLKEKKSWSTHRNGKSAQAHFICLTHNLLRLFEDQLENEGVVNKQDPKRREERLTKAIKKRGGKLNDVPHLLKLTKRLVQRSSIMLRWLKQYLSFSIPWEQAVMLLKACYLEFSR